MLNVKKRLILDADINFDITGTGEEVSFPGSDGKTYSGRKINASHMPLTKDTREAVAAVDVDTAIKKLHDKVENFTAGDILEQDLTITFAAEDSVEDIQLKINGQIKNLNGHTLTFVFPASLSQMLYDSITFQDFYNGSLQITGSSADRKVSIYDQLDINALFKIYRCQCEVVIENIQFIHLYSKYAVLAESSSGVVLKNCVFSGMTEVDSFALKLIASSGDIIDCQLTNDRDYDMMLSEKISFIENQNAEQEEDIKDLVENKAAIDFSNVTAPVQEFKDMVTRWLSPNYEAGVDVTAAYASGYTVPSDGWLYVRINKSGMAVYINDAEVSYGYESSSEMCCFVPVLTGQILTLRTKKTQAIVATTNEPAIFYPNR